MNTLNTNTQVPQRGGGKKKEFKYTINNYTIQRGFTCLFYNAKMDKITKHSLGLAPTPKALF